MREKAVFFGSVVVASAIVVNSFFVYSALPLFVAGGLFCLFRQRRLKKNEFIAIALTVTYFLAQYAGNFFVLAPYRSLWETLRMAGLPCAAFIIVLCSVNKRCSYWLLTGALITGGIILDFNILYNAVNGVGRTGGIAVLEFKNFFQWPDWLNSIICPFCAVMFLNTANWKKHTFWGALSFASLSASLLNGGRMLLLALFICALIYMTVTRIMSAKRLVFAVFVLFAVILMLYCIPTTRWRVLVMLDPAAMANADRLAVWYSAWKMFADFPLFGVGNGMFKYLLTKYYSFGHVFQSGELSHAHNLLLARLADSGIVGTVPFIAMLWYYFKTVYTKIKSKPVCAVRPEVLAGFMGMCGWLSMGLFDYCLRFPPLSLAFSIIAALTIARINIDDANQPAASG